MKRLFLVLLLLAIPLSAGAQGISQLQQWKTGGTNYITPINSFAGLKVPGLATSTNGCLSVGSSGWISANGSACGAGSGGSSFPFTPTTNYGAVTNSTSTPLWMTAGLQASSTSYFSNASSTLFTAPTAWISKLANLASAGFVKTASDGTLSVDTSTYLIGNQTITLSGVVSGSGSTAITTTYPSASANTVLANATGGSAAPSFIATSTFFGSVTPGKILAFLGGMWKEAATTTFSSGLTYLNGNVTADLGTSVDLTSEVTGDLPFANLTQGGANTVLANQTGGTADFAALSTSTFANGLYAGTAGQVLYRTSAGTWTGIASTTFSTGLTYANGAVTCDTGSATAFGCLTTANFNTFNNKVGTGTSETAGQIAVWNTTSGTPPKLYSLATSSATCSSGISCTGFNVLGSNAITFTNSYGYPFTSATTYNTVSQSTTTPIWFQGNGTYGIFASSTSVFSNASTTQLTVGGSAWFTGKSDGCATFATGVLNSTGSACGTTSITGSTGQTAYFSGVNTAVGTSTLFISTASSVGVGTSTPWARLSVDTGSLAANVPSFAVGSTTRNDFVITQAGNAAFGSTTSGHRLDVNSGTSYMQSRFYSNSTGPGGLFLFTTTADQAILTGGAEFTDADTAWRARTATPGILALDSGGLTYDYDSGIAVNALYTPTQRFRIFANGAFGLASTTQSFNWGIQLGTTTVLGGGQFAVKIGSSTLQAANQIVNWDSGNTQRYILNQNTTFDINATSSNPKDGAHYIIIACQDGTGSRTGTFATAQITWVGGNGATTTLSTGASSATFIGLIYDARLQRYYAIASSTKTDVRSCVP